MEKSISIIFPNQLFIDNPVLNKKDEIWIIEEYLFFRQYKFHKQKLAFHRASMKYYNNWVETNGYKVKYVESTEEISDIRLFLKKAIQLKVSKIQVIDPVDNWLNKRIEKVANEIRIVDSPMFLNTREELELFFKKDKKFFFQTTFYKRQRKKLNILMDNDEQVGGKWTFDKENRKKYPKNKNAPEIQYPKSSIYWTEAVKYVKTHFKENPGHLDEVLIYPINHKDANLWFDQFLNTRFKEFGKFEDAIVKEEYLLNHSLISPLLNVGLLDPSNVLSSCLSYSESNEIPVNSTESFVRQIIGWREFIRGMYTYKGSYSRTKNFWGFKRKMPSCFYDGTTGIEPVDSTIRKVLKTGYCHHIERLMILGNFMLLCEIDPNDVYQWFMELFIDAYDWVMVPNVYGMSQFSDGGLFATKPYISGSNYIKKMSNYKDGPWKEIWDGLFWRFLYKHRKFFSENPRLAMLIKTFESMNDEKKNTHLTNAEKFLADLK